MPQGDVCMHLTNYAINKHSKDFVRDDNTGSKRRIATVNRWFEENNYPVDKIWADIEVSRAILTMFILVSAMPVGCHHKDNYCLSSCAQA